MKTIFNSTLKVFGLSLALVAFTSCEKDSENAPASATEPTMGDPKSSSGGASRCYEISNFTDDGNNETLDYSNFIFEFFNNGHVIARNGSDEFTGSWSFGTDDGVQKFFLNFSGTTPLLNELSDDWNIVSLSGNSPSFIEDVNNNPDVLEFSRVQDCSGGGGTPSPELIAFNENLSTGGAWNVASFIDDGNNKTSDYNNTTFTFNSNGTVVAQRNNQSRTGQWVSQIDNSQIELIMQWSGPAILNEFNEDWDVVASSSVELSLIDDAGTPSESTLVFSRN
jgi:hypothetical protein